jgi:hypothetical protein
MRRYQEGEGGLRQQHQRWAQGWFLPALAGRYLFYGQASGSCTIFIFMGGSSVYINWPLGLPIPKGGGVTVNMAYLIYCLASVEHLLTLSFLTDPV